MKTGVAGAGGSTEVIKFNLIVDRTTNLNKQLRLGVEGSHENFEEALSEWPSPEVEFK
jgi:hypothetical protein